MQFLGLEPGRCVARLITEIRLKNVSLARCEWNISENIWPGTNRKIWNKQKKWIRCLCYKNSDKLKLKI